MSDDEVAFEQAWLEVHLLDGTLTPSFVDVPDGFYTRRLVLDGPLPKARRITESEPPDPASPYHYEPCRIPRYRKELRYVRGPFA